MFNFHLPHLSKKPQQCSREAIKWAAERIGVSYEGLQARLSDEERTRVMVAYESWKQRMQES